MRARVLLAAATLACLACSPSPTDAWAGFSNAALCGAEDADLHLSPQPVVVRTSGSPVALPAHVTRRGTPLSGTWSDFLADTRLSEDTKPAGGSGASASASGFTIRFLGTSAFSEAKSRCKAAVPQSDDAYALVISDGMASIAGTETGQARALSTLTELLEHATGGELPRASIIDAPVVQQRTVMEGFYGWQWDLESRLAAVRRAAALRMNVYTHAPKADYLSTFLWAQPYTDDDGELAQARTIAAYAKARGVEFCWELEPGGHVTYSDPAQLGLLDAKYDSLYAAGVRCFVLAFDDTDETLDSADQATGRAYGVLQADFIRKVATHLASLPEPASLAVVPNAYSTAMMQQDTATVAQLKTLPPSIELGWTGAEVVSPAVSPADVSLATELLGRPPALVDNYPVAGAGNAVGPLEMLPITGRDPAIFSKLSAYGGNAMVNARASFVALASIAELAWNPAKYDPERAFERGVEVAAGGPNDAFAFFAAQAEGIGFSSTGQSASAPELRADIAAYEADPHAGETVLVAFLTKLRGIDAGLASADPALVKEVAPWTEKAKAWSQLALDLVAAADQDPHGASAADLAAFQSRLTALEQNQVMYADSAFDGFAKRMIAQLSPQ